MLVLLTSSPAAATFIISTSIPTDIAPCQDTVFEITVTNSGGPAQAAGSLQYCLPTGISFVEVSGLNPLDVSDPRCPVFSLPALQADESISFQLRIRAACVDFDLGDVRDTISIISGGVPLPPLLGSAYNLRVPVITLLPGQNWNYTGANGDMFTRTFVLRNEGFGAAVYLFVIDSFAAAGLDLVQTAGTFNGDTLILTGTDLGPSGFLGYQDSVVITQTFQLNGCNNQAVIPAYGWGCPDGTICALPRFEQYQVSTGNNPAPNLNISLSDPFQTPRPCEPQFLEILVENTGQAPALGIEIFYSITGTATATADEAGKYACYPISGFNVNGVALPDLSGNFSEPYQINLSSILSDPDGAGGLSDEDGDGQFDDLAPGNSILLRCLVELDPSCKGCNDLLDAVFSSTQIRFSEPCGADLAANLAPNPKLDISFSGNILFDDFPFILQAGTEYNFEYEIDATYSGLSNLCPNDSLILEFVLPETLELPANFQPMFDSTAVPFWTQNDSLLFLLLPEPAGDLVLPVVPVCPPDIDDSAICTAPYDPRTYQLPARVYWTCGNGCPETFEMVCLSGTHFTIDCPRPEDSTQQHGIFADTIWMRRVSLGFTDNAMMTQVSALTPGLQTDAGIPYDTVQLMAEARIEGGFGDVFDSTTLQVYYWNGAQPYFTLLSANLTLEDAETGVSTSCPDLSLNYLYLNGYHIWEANLLPLIQAGGCLSGNGIQLSPGDRIKLEAFARLTEAWPDLEVEDLKDLRVRFPYVYHGDSLLCETKNGAFRAINPQLDYDVLLNFPGAVCDDLEVVVEFLQGKSGRVEDDLFPNEIRPLFVYDTLLVQLDAGYRYQPGSAFWEYEDGDGAVVMPVPVQVALPDPQLTIEPGGETSLLFIRPPGLPVTDYYMGRAPAALHFRAAALCPPDTTKLPVSIAGHSFLATLDSVNAQIQTLKIGDPDFNELILNTFSFLSSSREPTWIVEMCNSGPSFTIGTPLIFVENGPAVQITSATDITDPAVPQALTVVQADSAHSIVEGLSLQTNNCRSVELKATLLDCFMDTLRLSPGFQCDPSLAPCIISHPLELYFSPKISLAQINVSGSPNAAVALCEPIDYALTLINVGDGLMYDMEIAVQLPAAGQTLVPGSSVIEYNGQQVPLPDPIPGPDGLVWQINLDQLPFGLEALPGVFSQSNALTLHFQLETNCDYIDGTRFLYKASWADACGAAKNTANFVAPPLQIQGAPTNTNAYQIEVLMDNPASFCAENEVRVRIVNPGNLGPTAANEKVRFVLPAAFEYVTGSLSAVHNGPTGAPGILPFGDQLFVSFGLPAGVGAGDSMVFTFKIRNTETAADCLMPYDFQVQMTQTANVSCLNATCAIDFVLIGQPFSTQLQKPEFVLSGFSGQGLPLDAGLEDWQIDFQIENISTVPGGGSLQLEIRLDENQDGLLDPSDPLLQALDVDVEGLLPGAGLPVSQNVEVAATLGCSGIWLILTDTICSCTVSSVFIPFVQIENAGPDEIICAGDSISLGFPAQNGVQYEWIPASPYLNSGTSANPVYQFTGNFDPSLQFLETLVLKTTRVQGCVSFDTIQLITRKINLDLDATPVLCWGDSTGSVLASVQGAEDPVLFNWSNTTGQVLQQDSLPAGTYNLTVSDAYGCTAVSLADVTEPPPLSLNFTASDYNGFEISCAGDSDGALQVNAGGGAGGYQFDWTPAGSGPALANLLAGIYSVTLTDANGCSLSDDYTLTEPLPLSLALTVADEICPDASNGTISAQLGGGVVPYNYEGQPVAANFTISDLPAGMYSVLVTDANGCQIAADTTLVLLKSDFAVISDSVNCFGGADGSAEIQGSGFPPFSYNWSGGGNSAVFTGVAGNYTCTVTDALGCVYLLNAVIEEPELLSLSAMADSVTCFGDSTGQVTLTGSGGVLPYVYFSDGQMTSPVLANLPAGNYALSIVDGNGCTATLDVEIGQPEPLGVTLEIADAICFDSNTGSIEASASGGTQPYGFNWSTGDVGALLDAIPAGSYLLTLTDARGCTRIDSTLVGQPAPYQPVFEVLKLPCADRANGSLAVGGLPPGTRLGLNRDPFQTDTVFAGVAGGDQILQIEDSLGCLFEFEYVMPALPEMLGTLLADTVIHLGDSAWLRVELSPDIPPDEIDIAWLSPIAPLSDCDTCASLWVQPFRTAGYTVRFSSASGCQSESRVVVQVVLDSIYAPNVIYSDAVQEENRYFTLFARTSAVNQIRYLKIFDRWGEAVFEREGFPPNDFLLGWDGRQGSKLVLPGVFVWFAEVEFIDGRVLLIKGDLTVLH